MCFYIVVYSGYYPDLIKVNRWGTLLPPANEVFEGYVFTRVCLSTGGGGGIPACLAAGVLAGFQAHTQGGS